MYFNPRLLNYYYYFSLKRSFFPKFENLANQEAHFQGTGPEIWHQSGGRVDAFACAAGRLENRCCFSFLLFSLIFCYYACVCVQTHSGCMHIFDYIRYRGYYCGRWSVSEVCKSSYTGNENGPGGY